MNSPIVTRFAPSPTGYLHVGGVRTALYAWAFAKRHGGTFILRIEDTDKAREVEGSIPHIIESLKWLGISWDEGVDIGGPHAPYKQSERLDSYKKYAQILIEKGYAYVDPYTEEEVAALRMKAEEEKRPFLYREHRPTTDLAWDGTKPLRFKVKEVKQTAWHDAVRGDLSAGPEALDDFILIKSDGYPTYNFAHIIDDLLMEVTHIMRADEFIASTPKFLSVYEALEITPPQFVTLPPILAPAGNKKLGKRDGAKDILEYREDGYLPDAMVNFLAFLGWNPGGEKEVYTPEEIIEAFSIERIHSSGAMLQEEKLLWLNKEHIKLLSEEEKLSHVEKYMPEFDKEMLMRMLPSIIDRISVFGELATTKHTEFGFILTPTKIDAETLLYKDKPKEEAIRHLENVQNLLKEAQFASVEELKSLVFPYAEEAGKGDVLWPLRMSLTRQEKSMDPFSTLYALGKSESLARIEEAINVLSA